MTGDVESFWRDLERLDACLMLCIVHGELKAAPVGCVADREGDSVFLLHDQIECPADAGDADNDRAYLVFSSPREGMFLIAQGRLQGINGEASAAYPAPLQEGQATLRLALEQAQYWQVPEDNVFEAMTRLTQNGNTAAFRFGERREIAF